MRWRTIPRLAFHALIALATLGANCGRVHTLTEGDYTITLPSLDSQTVIVDSCGLATTTSVMLGGQLRLSGDIVRFEYQLYSIELIGQYKDGLESFYADGSAGNVPATLPTGEECLDDEVSVQLDAVTDSSTAFHGSMRISYQNAHVSQCNCELHAIYQATRQ